MTLLPATGLSPVAEEIEGFGVVFDSPGSWALKGKTCKPVTPRIVRCGIGKGEAVLVADVDFANPVWAATTNGRNYAALDALMVRLWPKEGESFEEQIKDNIVK